MSLISQWGGGGESDIQERGEGATIPSVLFVLFAVLLEISFHVFV